MNILSMIVENNFEKNLTSLSRFDIIIVKDERRTMKTFTELKTFDAVLRMSRFSTKRKGNDKKRLSKKACRGKVSW